MSENKYLIDTNLIDNPGRDARVGHDVSELDDLYVSIRENGILQPLLVRPRGDRYEVIAGNRRLQVARKLGLGEIPCMVRDADDNATAIFRFEENCKRSDITVVEEAKYIAESVTALGISIAEFADKVNRSVQWIEDRLSVADMPDYMQDYLMHKTIPLGVALALNEIKDDKVKKEWTYHAATHGMTVLAAQNALHEWDKLDRQRREAPPGAEVPELPATPPVAYARCERCGGSRPIQQMKFVRICNPVCQLDEKVSYARTEANSAIRGTVSHIS